LAGLLRQIAFLAHLRHRAVLPFAMNHATRLRVDAEPVVADTPAADKWIAQDIE
jgi:hypothetical protein